MPGPSPSRERPSEPEGASPIPVVVADDHPVVVSGVRQLFATTSGFALVGVVATGAGTVEVCAATRPRILLLDLRLPDLSATAVCRRVREVSPSTIIAVWTAQPDAMALRNCLRAGAAACLIKDVAERDLFGLLLRVATGRTVVDPRMAGHLVTVPDGDVLSPREREVLMLVARGLTTPRIAEHMGISANTVKTHRRSLLMKLGARNRVEALMAAEDYGLLRDDAP